MKKVSLLTLALLATAPVAVSAAEVIVPGAAPCAPTPCPCPKAFQGFYFGGNLGYGIGAVREQVSFNNAPTLTQKSKLAAQGLDGGVLVGYTHRFGNMGVGLDVYFNWANTTGRRSTSIAAAGNAATTYHNVFMQNNLEVRVPFSYVICNLVAPKVMLGWSNAQWVNQVGQGSLTNPNGSARFQNSSRYNGFLWGFGVDFLLAKHVISGLEYTGAVYGNKNFSDTAGDTASCRPVYNKFAVTLKFIY